MRNLLNSDDIKIFLEHLGKRVITDETIYLIGGSALLLLGSLRPTMDIDYVGQEFPLPSDSLAAEIKHIAAEMEIEVESVPFEEFIPLPEDNDQRHHYDRKIWQINCFYIRSIQHCNE